MSLPSTLLLALSISGQDTTRTIPAGSYADSATGVLVARARAARERNERLVTSYRATVTQRLGGGIKALSRDRMLFRQELAAKIEWHRDGPSKIEVTGAREALPIVSRGDHVPSDLDSQTRWLVINPAEDYLRVVGLDNDNDGFVYPLREGGERDYRFAIGDSTIISLPTGKRIRLVELRIIPRRSEWRLMSGSLWFDADTYGLVRAVFRPARPYEFRRDSDPEDREDVPKWVNATGEVKFVTLEYGLYENRWWMLRYVALDAVGSVGSWLGMPLRMERVYADYEVEGGTPPDPASTFKPAGTTRHRAVGTPGDSVARKAESDSIRRAIDECINDATRKVSGTPRDRQVVRVRVGRCTRPNNDSTLVVVLPADTAGLLTSTTLGEPILKMGDMISESEIRGLADAIGGLPKAPLSSRVELPRGLSSLLEKARYNRVEGLSLGLSGKADFGRFSFEGRGRIGIADGWPNLEGVLTLPGDRTRLRVAGYRRLTAANLEARPFGAVNSVFGLLAHRDDGQYFRAAGAELTVENPNSGWWSLRAYAERQTSARTETRFSIPRLLGSDAVFRPNITADRADQFGARLNLRLDRPVSRSVTLGGDLAFEGATGGFDFGKGSVGLRAYIAPGGPVAVAFGASAGTSTGTVPVQSRYYLGGPTSLRGYAGGVASGSAYWTARAEVGNSFPAFRLTGFSDIGWAGPRTDFGRGKPLVGAGMGVSVLDGLVRFDLSRGLRGPKGWRFDLYFDGIL